ncbi:MAG: (E)-4-hydroxy-3-methylbut-2-enyl-diphosphate synthase, partial [Acidobacteria bacterium]|nr:(E)-4-hydroxy-3-methylbut-2-enyl-diphosphate synthase [Acidobacteriota bacterium]
MGSDRSAIETGPITLLPPRRATLEVAIGDVVIGGSRPIAVQSMTTTRTSDAAATAAQIAALARAGCEIVRVTVPSTPDAEALPEIRRILAREAVRVPLVADIHFTPRLALQVVEHVEKVRVNPGNFADKKTLREESYDQSRWDRDVERLNAVFAPLVDRAKELGVAMRIGTNHGSLSDRILHRFGDTPEGMVASALEFVKICEDRGYHALVISMKASNTQVMTRAYRLLAQRLDAQGSRYPLHLGVTEAGGGDEGRIKSAAGIATLLLEGLGDTVRVSLTEDPVHEVPVARELVQLFAVRRIASRRFDRSARLRRCATRSTRGG